MNPIVQVNASKAQIALSQFRLNLQQRKSLLTSLGDSQLLSVMKNFDEETSGGAPWPPLSPNSLRWRKYTAGHKLLIGRGRLRNSIYPEVSGNSVRIGSHGVWYSVVQFLGWTGTQNVSSYSYARKQSTRDQFSKEKITDKRGRQTTVTRKALSGVAFVTVKAHTRRISIPARNPLVFRPEDPQRLESIAKAFVLNCARQAGLETNQ